VHIASIFDATPLDEQPSVIADMGSGDGTLLRLLYTYIAQSTARGRHLDARPLTMVGVDFNAASRRETAATLTAAGVPHLTLPGDIGDPATAQARRQTLHTHGDRLA